MARQKQKQYMAKYLASPKGIAARKRAQDRYNNSRKGRAARVKYLRTSKGREAVADYKRRRQLLKS